MTRCWHNPELRVTLYAGFALTLGVAVYIVVRDPTSLYLERLLPDVTWPALIKHQLTPSLIKLTASLPTGLHTFAFSLFTAAVIGIRDTPIKTVTIAWGVVESAFEFLQMIRACVVEPIFCCKNFVELVCAYASQGTFDTFDVASIVLGAFAALLVLKRISHMLEDENA